MEEEIRKRKMDYDIDFDFEEEEQQSGISYITIIALFIAITGFLALSWYAYTGFRSSEETDQIPVIIGNKTPYKVTTDEIENDINSNKEYFSHFNKKEIEVNAKIAESKEEPISKELLEESLMKNTKENILKSIAPRNKTEDESAEAKNNQLNNNSIDNIDIFADSFIAEKIKKDKNLTASDSETLNNLENKIKEDINNETPSIENKQADSKLNKDKNEQKKEEKVAVINSSKPAIESKNNTIKIEPKSSLSKKLQKKLKINANTSHKIKDAKVHPNSNSIVYHESFKVQLGSFKNKTEAVEFWSRFKTEQIDIIGGLTNNIEQREIKDQGVFYRLQMGAFVNYANARNLCSRLKSRNIDCFVVKS